MILPRLLVAFSPHCISQKVPYMQAGQLHASNRVLACRICTMPRRANEDSQHMSGVCRWMGHPAVCPQVSVLAVSPCCKLYALGHILYEQHSLPQERV